MFVYFFLHANLSLAQGPETLVNPSKVSSIEAFLDIILSFVTRIGGPIVAIMIIWVGFKFVIARGKPEKIKEAREALGWTLLGAAIVLGAAVIQAVVIGTVEQVSNF